MIPLYEAGPPSGPRPAMRGVEFYGDMFRIAYQGALRNFQQFHKRLPDADTLPKAADHLFFSKFFRAFPTVPNAASKLNAEAFLDRNRFGDRIHVPRRMFVSAMPSLPEDLFPALGWWLKLDLGNASHVRLQPAHLGAGRRILEWLIARGFTPPRYGWGWGEWWYSASPQRFFFEEDLTDRMPGDEYQFFMKRGACVMFKKKRIHHPHDPAKKRTVSAFFDHAGSLVPGLQNDNSEQADASLSPHCDTMLEAACQIGAAFDYIRVDFIDLHDAPALGELTFCTMNARLAFSTDALEQLARNAARLDPIPVA